MAMSLALQLLGGLLDERRLEQPELCPAVRDELADAPHGPSGLELADDVGEVLARVDTEAATRLNQAVGGGEARAGVSGAGKEEVSPPHAGFAEGALDEPVSPLCVP